MIVYIVKAFCRYLLGGNLAGVVLLEFAIAPAQMQYIATELQFSETVFLSKTGPTSYKTLYFTPTSPIEFCGHATLAAFGVLKERGEVTDGVYQLDTPAGPCEISISNSLIFLSQPLPIFGEIIPVDEIALALGISTDEIAQLKSQIVSTGLRDIFVPLNNRECLMAMKPNMDEIAKICKKYNAIGMHVFSLESQIHCRNFAPLYGIPEESATGSSNGALACYLFHNGQVPEGETTLLFKQGDVMKEPSDIFVRLQAYDQKIQKVECGGEVVVAGSRNIILPDEPQSSLK